MIIVKGLGWFLLFIYIPSFTHIVVLIIIIYLFFSNLIIETFFHAVARKNYNYLFMLCKIASGKLRILRKKKKNLIGICKLRILRGKKEL